MKQHAIKKELTTYLPLLSAGQQALILEMVKSILHVDGNENRISVEQYNAEIEAALKEVKNGKGISHNEMKRKSAKWLKRK